ncbi:hypothetical protein IT408_03480 [Candidatus Uhrbacteria bacterium]|nr:hypothetical protein [Candidatus Uhrbacteria bacterium]
MNLQQFGETKKPEAHLENLEMRTQKPEDAAKETLRLADRMLTDEKSRLEVLKRSLDEKAPERAQIKILEDEVDAAWEDLSDEVKAAVAEKPAQVAVTEEELDWSLPEEKMSPNHTESVSHFSVEGKTEEEIIDILNTSLEQAFKGDPMSSEKLSLLLRHPSSAELAEKFIIDECQSRIFSSLDAHTFDLASFQRVLDIASHSTEAMAICRGAITESIGPKMTERIMREPGYMQSLQGLQESLSKPLREDGPDMCSRRDFKNLIAIKETVGDYAIELAHAIDFKQSSSETEASLSYNMSKGVIDVERIGWDEKTGELITKISMSLAYLQKEKASSSEEQAKHGDASSAELSGMIARNIVREVAEDENGQPKVTTFVEHSIFKLPDGIKDSGIAAETTRRSLEIYGSDKLNLDEIRLHANIDVGGYAWASYGYGWDHEGNASKRLATLAEKGEEIVVGGREVFEYSELTAQDKKELSRMEIAGIIDGCGTTLDSISKSVARRGGTFPADLYQTFSDLIEAQRQNPDVTPQDLAIMGTSLPKIYQTVSGEYYLEDEWSAAQQAGEVAANGFKKPAHFGKLALLGSNWYGKIELSQDGSQEGKNLKMLQKTLERRT